jgi:hypothetical protein
MRTYASCASDTYCRCVPTLMAVFTLELLVARVGGLEQPSACGTIGTAAEQFSDVLAPRLTVKVDAVNDQLQPYCG